MYIAIVFIGFVINATTLAEATPLGLIVKTMEQLVTGLHRTGWSEGRRRQGRRKSEFVVVVVLMVVVVVLTIGT